MKELYQELAARMEGEFHTSRAMRTLYATDASAYRELPEAVALPKTVEDIRLLIEFARQQGTSLIPRTAGTSLAGQVVGKGIVVDVSKYFTGILELNTEEKWVRVQPGVIRDELNMFLKPHGLFFGPETSTANRAMIGGMVGNNSCGSNSVVYRSTREHLLEAKVLLSDGSEAVFGVLDIESFHQKCEGETLEAAVYRNIRQLLSQYENQVEIRKEYPKRTIERRNTGYAIDLLVETAPFTAGGPDFNFCQLIAGSEGTLAFITEVKLNVVPLPPPEIGLLCVHFESVDESLRANLIALQYNISASELIDHYILECTKNNIEQQKNRFFVKGDPGAILVIEFARQTREEVQTDADRCTAALKEAGLGYHYPLLFGADTKKIWTLRKAGLGLLGNMPGSKKPVPVIEDTAVDVNDLPAYIREFNSILQSYGLHSVHYAHAGSGEIHLRPILDLKTEEGNQLFRTIAQEIAKLVKRYQGSLSGEHGDGRLRGEFIRQMIGEKNFELLRSIKEAWDPQHIFNPNKIVDTPPMNTMLRYTPGQKVPEIKTVFRFGDINILQHAEQCNGSGDCRKTQKSGGTMCPSYMATRSEQDTTRARANILREFLTHSEKLNRFDHEEIYEVMDLCLSCKGCKSECPSNVDVAKLKAEFLQHYYDAHGVPFRAKVIAGFNRSSSLASIWPGAYNFLIRNKITSGWIKSIVGFHPQRSLPPLQPTTLLKWAARHRSQGAFPYGKVYLFADEFTNFSDAGTGIHAIQLLEKLGYEVVIPQHVESGRASLSKGLLRKAQVYANQNVEALAGLVTESTPLIGVEPSAILCFRDEYIDLVDEKLLEKAKNLSRYTFTFEEFLAREVDKGRVQSSSFTQTPQKIQLHGHCQQKALSSVSYAEKILSLPVNYEVEVIPSGCCGMAGSFGYEKEHYDLSMKVGELVLFPAIRKASPGTILAAAGTSCRHQVKDGTGVEAKHPVDILFDALV